MLKSGPDQRGDSIASRGTLYRITSMAEPTPACDGENSNARRSAVAFWIADANTYEFLIRVQTRKRVIYDSYVLSSIREA